MVMLSAKEQVKGSPGLMVKKCVLGKQVQPGVYYELPLAK